MSLTQRVTVGTSEPDLVVEAEAVRIGTDVLVYVWGGTRPHIGAVAAAVPRPSLADGDRTSATASVLTYPGHKEDSVVKSMAEALAAALDTNVVVTAGIHWDGLDQGSIATIVSRCREVTELLIRGLKGEPR